MQRVVIHLCSPLLCQRSWLQRQLLKDGMILVTICVGIVAVQHQVLTTSLSLGIVMKAELSYRLLVTLLFASEQQWGNNAIDTSAAYTTYTFPIAFSSNIYSIVITPYKSGGSGYKHTSLVTAYTKSNFTTYVYDRGYVSHMFWIAIGK